MNSISLTGIKEFTLQDIPIPDIGPGQVLVAIKSVGICGSDVHYYQKGRIGSDRCVFPQSLGHECAGQVVKTSTPHFKEGDRVAIEPAQPCMRCEHCLTGHHNRCPYVRFLGSPGMPGAFREYLVLDNHQVEKIPDSMSYDEAAMLEPLGVAYHAIGLADMKPDESVAIFGAGSVGLLVLAMARACGAGETFICDRLQYRLDAAREFYDVDHVVDVTKTDPLEYINDITGGRGFDITYEAAGQPETFNWSFEAARIGGKAFIIGIPEADAITFNPHPIRRKELLIQTVRRSNRALTPCIDLVARKRIDVIGLATHQFTLETITDAFEMVSRYGDGVIRAMIHI